MISQLKLLSHLLTGQHYKMDNLGRSVPNDKPFYHACQKKYPCKEFCYFFKNYIERYDIKFMHWLLIQLFANL